MPISSMCYYVNSGKPCNTKSDYICFVFLFFNTGSHYVAQTRLELKSPPTQPWEQGLLACATMLSVECLYFTSAAAQREWYGIVDWSKPPLKLYVQWLTKENITEKLTSISLFSYLSAFRPPWLFLLIFFNSAWDFSKESNLFLCSAWYLFRVACKSNVVLLWHHASCRESLLLTLRA